MTESTFYTFLKLVDYFVGHGCRDKHELYLDSLQHVKYFVEKNLLSGFHIVLYILKDEDDKGFRVSLKVL